MANIKSAKKRIKVTAKRQAANKPIVSATKTYLKKARAALSGNDSEVARAAVDQVVRILDKAAQKGVLHPNSAARRKSRLTRKLNKALSASPS